MKPLAVSTILLIVIANAVLSCLGIQDSIVERFVETESVRVAVVSPHATHLLPVFGSVALVGISLLMSGGVRRMD